MEETQAHFFHRNTSHPLKKISHSLVNLISDHHERIKINANFGETKWVWVSKSLREEKKKRILFFHGGKIPSLLANRKSFSVDDLCLCERNVPAFFP